MTDNIDIMPKPDTQPNSTDPIPRLDDIPQPVIWQPSELDRDESVPAHFHDRAQLLFAASGVMTVTTESGIWVVPPNRAVWIPPGALHAIRANTALSLRNVYIDTAAIEGLSNSLSVVGISSLLRELILEVFTLPPLYDNAGSHGRLVAVLVDRIRQQEVVPLHLPLPTSRPARRIAEGILEDTSNTRSLGAWANAVGSSSRTVARQFPAETGMTFGHWRRRARLLEALRLLADGVSVTTVAMDLGYSTQSAFIAMFKKELGKTPGKYFAGPSMGES